VPNARKPNAKLGRAKELRHLIAAVWAEERLDLLDPGRGS
jgi:hypothetical protein